MSLFTSWRSDEVEQLWIKRRVAPGSGHDDEWSRFGATPATSDMHPIAELSAEPCTRAAGCSGTVARPAAPLPHGLHAK